MPRELALPASREELAELRAGEEVRLSGPVYTARDATHARIVGELREACALPYGLEGQVLFYAGPTPASASRVLGAVGPTTAKRMDAWTPELLEAGIVATIGKGARSAEVREACVRTGSVYFAAVGGAAALLATHVEEAEVVAYPELGTEALMGLTLQRFPVFVAIDAHGGDLYAEAPAEWRADGGPGLMAGVFITFEGGEGAGKSTQIELLAAALRERGLTVTTLREPGGTAVGDRVRDLLLDPVHTGLDPRAELLLYEASRAELVAEEIVPRLAAGDIVVCDRFGDSTLAYQGYGRGLNLEGVRALNEWATGGLAPDITILLDVEPALGLARATGEGADRLEAEDVEFHERVREGFLALADGETGDRFVVIEADAPAEEVGAAVWETLRWHPAMSGMLD